MTEEIDLRRLVALNIDPDAWHGDENYSTAANIARRGPSLHKADAVLAIPRIAEALKLKVVKTMGENG